MSPQLRFTFPLPPNLANGRHHWRALHRKRAAYYQHLDLLLEAKQLPAPPERPFQRCLLAATLHLGAAMDDDNAMHRVKWPLDWIKTRGYVADDRKANIQWAGFPRQIVRRLADKSYTVDFTLTPLIPPPSRTHE